MDLTAISIFDHHAHPLRRPDAVNTPAQFLGWFTESIDPAIHAEHVPQTLLLRSAVRWLAALLDCAPALDAVVAARAAQPETTWVRRLFADANIATVLCDYGYGDAAAYDHAAMQALLPCRVAPILRLETMAETLILAHASFDDVIDAFTAAVESARRDGYVALKSIAAYRTGLDIGPVSAEEARLVFADVRENAERTGHVRLAARPLNEYLLGLALAVAQRQRLPVQFHSGFGDRDADLRTANPLHLRRVIETYPDLPLVLLHAGWPYWRELAHLSALYANVWMDLSLAVPFATAGIPAMLREILGMAPWSKVLFATDAFTMPEIYWLAARWGRWGLGRVLAEFVAEDLLTHAEADVAARAILHDNARGLYM